MTIQSTSWCFTWNNPPDYSTCYVIADDGVPAADFGEIPGPPESWDGVTYLVYQYEKGESGTPHFQGYAEFGKRMSLKGLKELNYQVSWRKRKGSQDQAINYCMKEDTRIAGPWEFGERSKQGERTDLAAIAEYVKSHTMAETAEAFPSQTIRYGRQIAAYKAMIRKPRDFPTELIIYWGAPHTGKSYHVHHLYPTAYTLQRPRGRDTEPWWDGYEGQETVIADEYNSPWMSITLLCNLICSQPFQVEPKGQPKVEFTSKRLVLISNRDPFTWYKPEFMTPELGLLRRIEDCTINHVLFPYPGVPMRRPAAQRNKPYVPPNMGLVDAYMRRLEAEIAVSRTTIVDLNDDNDEDINDKL